jgi:hypothetical protein
MFQKLVSHNDDLGRLVEKGYAVALDSNHLIIRDVPYLDGDLNLQWGAIVTQLSFINNERVEQVDHQVFFAGSHPHNLDGIAVGNLAGGPARVALSDACKDVVIQRSFSHKPCATGKYADFFEKIERYVTVLSGPAIEKYGVSPLTCRVVTNDTPDSVFKFQDTLTSRAEITDLVAKFKNDVVAVIGLGGTGAYVLDFLVKTPVREIRAFDLDAFHVHNAFRSPGRLDEVELGKSKVEVYAERYKNFRTGLSLAPKFIDSTCSEELEGVTFAFVCVDKGSSRSEVFELLISKSIPFIDVGMGLNRKHGPLGGMLRSTHFSVANGAEVRSMGLAELSDRPDDIYRANIQISELNALNASLAMIRFKQLRGFYFEELPQYHFIFGIGDLKITGESESHEV